jgi:outer membrane protein assembly factor BamB
MNSKLSLFNINEGIGGFEQGSYDREARHPINTNWTRKSRFSVPDSPQLLWKVGLDNGYLGEMQDGASFVINSNKEVLVVENDNNLILENSKGRLIRISNNSGINEIFCYNRNLKSPIIGKDGLIYLSTNGHSKSLGHKLFCLTPDGNLKWEYLIDHQAHSNPVLDESGNLYLFTFIEGEGALLSISKNGTLNWQRKFQDVNWNDPTISQNGIIYIGLNISKTLCAFSKTGDKLWEIPFGREVAPNSINIREDGMMYLCQDGFLYAINPDGSIQWRYKPEEGHVRNVPAMDEGGNLYLNLTPFWLAAVDCDGAELWRREITGAAHKAPILGNNGKIIQQSFMQNHPQYQSWIEIYSTKGEKLWTYEMKGTLLSTVLAEDNLLYALTNIFTYKRKGWKDKMDVKWELHAIGKEN